MIFTVKKIRLQGEWVYPFYTAYINSVKSGLASGLVESIYSTAFAEMVLGSFRTEFI